MPPPPSSHQAPPEGPARAGTGPPSAGTVADVTVVGSANTDVVLAVARHPSAGETVTAEHRGEAPGGKGLNQAVGAARSGATTAFIGSVGDDARGRALRATMAEEGIETSCVRWSLEPTGMATIVLQSSGENTILVVPGANSDADIDDPAALLIRRSRVLVTQLEIPVATVATAVLVARDAGVLVVVNAAPATPLDDDLLAMVDVLVVNEHEAVLLGADEDPLRAAAHLCSRCERVVVTLGARGAVLVGPTGPVHREPGLPVEVVDTTGAGDAFVGALAAALARGRELTEAIRHGTVAGAAAVESHGGVPAIPASGGLGQRLRSD